MEVSAQSPPEPSRLSHPKTLRAVKETTPEVVATNSDPLKSSGTPAQAVSGSYTNITPPLPPARYIRLLRNFRCLFHWRPARRCRHGKTRIRPGIRRHRTGQGRSAIREPKSPCFRGLQLSVWNFGSRPGKERLKTSVSGSGARGRVVPRALESSERLGRAGGPLASAL